MKAASALAVLLFAMPICGQDKPPSPETRMKMHVENQRYDARLAELENKKAIAEGRKPAPKAPPVAPEPLQTTIHYPSWDEGEIKECETYSGQPNLLICDPVNLDWKDSFANRAGRDAAAGMNDEESYQEALIYARLHGKQFLVGFSEHPWPEPLPHTGIKMTLWNCTKEKPISCKFAGRDK